MTPRSAIEITALGNRRSPIAIRKAKIRSASATYVLNSSKNHRNDSLWNRVTRIEEGQTEGQPVPEMSGMTKKEFLHNANNKLTFEVELKFAALAVADPKSNVIAVYGTTVKEKINCPCDSCN
jgi:hypothetical protein